MSHKNPKIVQLIQSFQGRGMDPHYLGYFECFNTGRFYEAHDVLEALWLGCRKEPRGDFYKGLIQLAGAFVHLQKNRLGPAAALLALAAGYLRKFRPVHERLNVDHVLAVIGQWLDRLEHGSFSSPPLEEHPAPALHLENSSRTD